MNPGPLRIRIGIVDRSVPVEVPTEFFESGLSLPADAVVYVASYHPEDPPGWMILLESDTSPRKLADFFVESLRVAGFATRRKWSWKTRTVQFSRGEQLGSATIYRSREKRSRVLLSVDSYAGFVIKERP